MKQVPSKYFTIIPRCFTGLMASTKQTKYRILLYYLHKNNAMQHKQL